MDRGDISWKKYLSYFKYWFLAIFLLAVLAAVLFAASGKGKTAVRTNSECDTPERVFDYADVLTEEEEEALREKIAGAQARTACDIVLVTLNESLADYARARAADVGTLEPYQYTMVCADDFYEEHGFGYDRPNGDGVLLLDNWYREADGGVYSWLSTCGRAEERFSSAMIDALLQEALADVERDPFGAYARYVELFVREMTRTGAAPDIPVFVPAAAALLGTALFVGSGLKGHKGSRTVNLTTYVKGGRPELKRQKDIFLRKTVTKRHLETQDGSGGRGGGGGGGHHISPRGVSHGGGGHRR